MWVPQDLRLFLKLASLDLSSLPAESQYISYLNSRFPGLPTELLYANEPVYANEPIYAKNEEGKVYLVQFKTQVRSFFQDFLREEFSKKWSLQD